MSVSRAVIFMGERLVYLRTHGHTYAHDAEEKLIQTILEKLRDPSGATTESQYLHPGYGKFYPVQTVLRDLASQENCDGEPYDAMCHAADYVDILEKRVRELELKNEELSQLAVEEHTRAHKYEHAGLAINFFLDMRGEADAESFLRSWNEGAWDELDRDWPEWKKYVDTHR